MRPVTLLAVVITLSLPTPTFAQQPKTDTYLLQLAAAVAGYSGGAPVYVVICGTREPYKIVGAFQTADQATAAANAVQGRDRPCTVEGPYTSGPAYAGGATTYGSGCKKAPDSSCLSDSSAVIMAPIAQVSRVAITYTMRNGVARTESFNPRDVEAVFFTMAAVDRMLIPYFVKVYGVDQTVRQRAQLLRKFGARPQGP